MSAIKSSVIPKKSIVNKKVKEKIGVLYPLPESEVTPRLRKLAEEARKNYLQKSSMVKQSEIETTKGKRTQAAVGLYQLSDSEITSDMRKAVAESKKKYQLNQGKDLLNT